MAGRGEKNIVCMFNQSTRNYILPTLSCVDWLSLRNQFNVGIDICPIRLEGAVAPVFTNSKNHQLSSIPAFVLDSIDL